jgi:flagellar hook-associated protein 3 FlgL
VVDPTAYVQDSYTITFTTPTDYEVRDGGGGLVSTGTYATGQAIAFLGIEIGFDGEPAAGDVFTVEPSVNKDVFTMVADLIATVEGPAGTSADRAQLHSEIGQSLTDLDQAIGNLLDVRGELGARLRAVDSEIGLNEGFSVQLSATLSGIQDLDYAEAISLLSLQLQGLEATQQTYTRLQGLSLFRFL